MNPNNEIQKDDRNRISLSLDSKLGAEMVLLENMVRGLQIIEQSFSKIKEENRWKKT